MKYAIYGGVILGLIAIVFFGYLGASGDRMFGGRTPGDSAGFGVSIYDDTSAGMARLDSSTEALETIDYAHHEIHSGSHYTIARNKMLTDTGASTTISFKTPNTTKEIHFFYVITAEKLLDVYFLENIATTTVGTTLIPINNKRNSANTSAMYLALDALASTTFASSLNRCTYAASTTPCIIYEYGFGASGTAQSPGRGGAVEHNKEIILKPNTSYVLKAITGSADDSDINFFLDWYEHTPRN